ncbi:hypothetical protein FB561_1618 [Kribbella amoyensis]|uniref:Uncharacterized protein n=1 Tax=Kribbella amoyensis TaxID=996641 RepID=A0A561BNV0_9ACTN|nr:hypothetical protein [Kribbella amoyensis]TWD80537.1 hypothetical protein FB561_1618 [Kribbella amoyensis]
MDYDQFDAVYGQVLVSARSLDAAALESEVDRLRTLADSLDSPADQQAAHLLVASLQDAVARSQRPVSAEMAAAVQIQTHARTSQGTSAERIKRIRAGIDQIATIAETADVFERGAILDLNTSLVRLLDTLTLDGPDDGAEGEGTEVDGGR